MTDQFADPGTATGDSWSPSEHLGTLTMFTVDKMSEEISTVNGPATPLICSHIVALDGDTPGAEFSDSFIFGKALIPQLKGQAGGGKVLGRVGQGKKEAGKNQAWIILPATDADKDLARQWIARTPVAAAPAGNPFD